jgi:hypothetical protein
VENKVRGDYGFLHDLSASVGQNTQPALEDIPLGYYFSSPSNLKFHNLTPGRSLLPAPKMVLGLSKKFILIPKAVNTENKRMEFFERFEQDFGWKV